MTEGKINFLASCYQADIRAISLLNFFSKKVAHQLFLKTADILLSSGSAKLYPVSAEWAKEVEKTQAIYSKEKSLYCCAFYLAGSINIAGKVETVMAPVYLYSAELIKMDEGYDIAIYEENPVINPAIIDVDSNSEAGKYEDFSAAMPTGYFDEKKIGELQQKLSSFFPQWDATMMQLFPQLIPAEGTNLLLKKAKAEQKFVFIPAIGLCLMDKPSGSRGILNELATMTARSRFSHPIDELLSQKWSFPYHKPFPATHVPALLSKRQAAIVENVGRWPLQLIIGPPGTGKSFTIAALAIEMLSRGKSVLIASKNDEACNVVADKIERDLEIEGVVIRASRRDYKTELQKRIQNLLDGIDLDYVDQKKLNQLDKTQRQLQNEITKLETRIEELQQKRLEDGVFLYQYDGGIVQKIQKSWVSWRHENLTPLWKLTEQLGALTRERHRLLKSYIKTVFNHQLGKALDKSRLELQYIVNAAKARTGNRKEAFFESIDFKTLLKALPIWTANTADIHRVLPLEISMFDLVIIDEATQCDIASSLPILQRGKSALIVGDPKQLRHLSFLSNRQQQALAKQFQISSSEADRLNYRQNSLLDVVSNSLPSQERVHFLDEHYRSMPDIIAFSNAHFYNNRLKVMTSNPTTQTQQHLFIHKILGKRHDKGHNTLESEHIMLEIRKIMDAEAGLEPLVCKSIGIISPIREQVNHLQRQVEKEFPTELLMRHRVKVGTPFSFQGEERDFVFLSFVLDDTSHPSAFQYLNREDIFNVSITRARSQQHLIVSFETQSLPASSLTRKYIYHAENAHSKPILSPEINLQHEFLASVRNYLLEIGVTQVFMAHSIAGVQIDFLVIVNGRSYGIDIIGHPNHWGNALHLDDWKMLFRTGISLFYLSYSEWYFDEIRVKKAIARFLGL